MKRIQLFFPFYAIVLLLLNSCAPSYIPNVINAPMLTNKGEFQASMHFGASGFNPQFTYAITNHLGIMANASFMDATTDSTSNSYHKHSFYEFGPGYYTNFGSRFKFGLYGGYGFGTINAVYENSLWTSRSDVKCSRLFLQPTIGITSSIFDLGLSSRFVVVSFNQEGLNPDTGVMFEPAITAKLGYEHIKAVGQIGLSLPINSDNIHFNYQFGLVSLGIQANFGKIFK
jgi:hypothetical protein